MAVSTRRRWIVVSFSLVVVLASFSAALGKRRPSIDKLAEAVVDNDAALVRKLVEQGAPLLPRPDRSGVYGNIWGELFPLQVAVRAENLAMTELLVSLGSDVNFPPKLENSSFGTVLHQAAMMGNLPIIKVLVSAGADVNRQGGDWGTPLLEAIKAHPVGLQDTVRFLIESGANLNLKKREELSWIWKEDSGQAPRKVEIGGCGATALHEAVEALDPVVVDYLLAHGADPGATDVRGLTPRQCAEDRLTIVEVESLKPRIHLMIDLLDKHQRSSDE